MLRISLAPGLPEGTDLPQILCYDELESMDTMMWLGMQNVLIVNDRCSCHTVCHAVHAYSLAVAEPVS